MAATKPIGRKKRFASGFLPCLVLIVVGIIALATEIPGRNPISIAFWSFFVLFFGLGVVVLGFESFGKPPPVPKWFKQTRTGAPPVPKTREVTLRNGDRSQSWAEGDGEALERTIEALAKLGVFAPEIPTTQQLQVAAADYGPPAGVDLALSSLYSTPHYDESFSLDAYTENLRFQILKVEQTAEVVESQVTDLVELSNGALQVRDLGVEFGSYPGNLVTVTGVQNDEPFEVIYCGANKWMSTIVIQQIAKRYEEMGLPTRFAAITVDSGIYLTLLNRGGVEELNDYVRQSDQPWALAQWADEEAFAFEAGYPD